MAKNLSPSEKTIKLVEYQRFWLYDLLSDRDLTGYPPDVIAFVENLKKELRS
jgi:hypothetical protein